MSQIRWDNVGSTVSGSAGTAMMDSARKSLQGSFSSLQTIMDREAQTQKENFGIMRDNNTDAVLDKLHSLRTPEELEAAREQGVFRDMKNQFGAAVDRGAIRDALDGRGAFLRGETEARQGFEDGQHNRGLRDQVQDLRARALGGEDVTQDALALGYRDTGEMLSATFGDFRQGMGEQRAQAGEERAEAGERRAQQNHHNALEDRARRLADEKRQSAVAAQLMGQIGDFQANIADRNERLNLVAREVGIDVDFNSGNMQGLYSVDADTLDLFNQAIEAEGLTESMNPTAFARSAVNRLTQEGMLTSPTEVAQAFQGISAQLSANSQLLPEDQNWLNSRETEITELAESRQADLEARNQRMIQQNIFLEDGELTSERMNISFDEVSNVDSNAFFSRSNYKDMNEFATKMAMRGVEVGGERVDIPPVVMKGIIRNASQGRFRHASQAERSINRFIEQNVDQIRDATAWTLDYQEEQAQINQEQLEHLGDAHSSIHREAGTILDQTRDLVAVLDELARKANE